jgi:hypothetical protein
MKNETTIREMIESLKQQQGDDFQINEEETVKEYAIKKANKSTLTIKILSIVGGNFASGQFLGFLFLMGLFNSGTATIILGLAFIIAALVLSHVVRKLIFDTLAIFGLAVGFLLLALGLFESKVSENAICCWLMIAGAASFLFAKNSIIIFISFMIFSESILTLILLNRPHEMIHLFIAVNTLALAYWMLNEGAIITRGKRICELYDPVRIALIFTLIASLSATMMKSAYDMPLRFAWISSLVMIPVLLYIIKCVLDIINVAATKEKAVAYLISSLILLATIFAPAISGALIVILLCFLVNYKTGFVVGVLAFIYFVSQYYYDLNITLLTKSIFMMASGVLFILFYLLTSKKLENNEKI